MRLFPILNEGTIMVRCLSKLMEKPVLGYYSGRMLGAVCGFTLHPESHHVLGVMVKRHKWSAPRVFPMDDISRDSSRLSLLAYAEEGERRGREEEERNIVFPPVPRSLGFSSCRDCGGRSPIYG